MAQKIIVEDNRITGVHYIFIDIEEPIKSERSHAFKTHEKYNRVQTIVRQNTILHNNTKSK